MTAARVRSPEESPSAVRPVPRLIVSGGDGRFALELPPGAYALAATSEEGMPARQPRVAVLPGKYTQVALRLQPGGALFTGEVSDSGGGPIAGARALLRPATEGGSGSQAVWLEARADDGGRFRVRLPAGDYDLVVRAEGYAPTRDRLALAADQSRRYRLNPAAHLAGRVLDRRTREPVEGANVWLRLDRLESFVDRTASSGPAGDFAFDDLAAGGYVVLARQGALVGLSRTVDVGVAKSVTDIEVLVEPGRTVRGRMVGSDGQGVAGAWVAATRADPYFDRPVFVQTSDSGAFALEGLMPARYRIEGWVEGRGRSSSDMVVVGGRDVEGVRLELGATRTLRGQVVAASGQGVAGATVVGMLEMGGRERQVMVDRATTDEAGAFRLTHLGQGKLTVTARHPLGGVGRWGPDTTPAEGQSLTVRLEAGASISGAVRFEDGRPAAEVTVVAPLIVGVAGGPPAQVSTDAAGRYRIEGLEKGRYMVTARRGTNPAGFARARQEVAVTAGDQKAGVDLVVPGAGKRITGRVIGPEGTPVAGALVSAGLERNGVALRPPAREGFPAGGFQAVSEMDGAFALDELQEGQYVLWASDSTHADGEVKGVTAGAANVEIRLQRGASASGVVRTRDGQPVSDYTIAALPAMPAGASPDARVRSQVAARLWSPSAQVHDGSGAFSIARLSPGDYELTVSTAENQAGILPVTITAGQAKQGLVVVIDAAATLVGKVLEAEGGPLGGVEVTLASATARLSTTTEQDGSFTLTGVSPGRARLDLRPAGLAYVPEHADVQVKPRTATVDLGILRVLKGNLREKLGSSGSIGRVGFTVTVEDGRPSVTAVVPGFPGEKAGLKGGELVESIDGRAVGGLGNGALDFLAAGRVDQPLTLVVRSHEGGSTRQVVIQRVAMSYDPSGLSAARAGSLGASSSNAPDPSP